MLGQEMFRNWKCPDWGEPWDARLEFDWATKISMNISEANPDLSFKLDVETEGCLYVELWRSKIMIGTFTLSALNPDYPMVSLFMGVEEDEFNLRKLKLIAVIPKHYWSEYSYPKDEEPQHVGAGDDEEAV